MSKGYKKIGLFVFSILLLVLAVFNILKNKESELVKSFLLFDSGVLLVVFFLFLGTVFLSYIRAWVIFSDLGRKLPFLGVAQACIAGNIGALFFIPIFGQVAGRHIYLNKLGVSAVENSTVAGYERITAGAVSAVFALLGAFFIYGVELIGQIRISLLTIFFLSSIAALLVFFKFLMSEQEKIELKVFLSLGNIFLFSRVIFIVVLSMLLTMLCFALMFSVVLPEASCLQLISIGFIVSFMASLPISFGGWGLREVSSMYFVTHLGGAAEAGFAASFYIGIISTLIVLMFYPFLFVNKVK